MDTIKINKKYMRKTFKEILLITISIILLFGGLGLTLTNELVNGITLLGIIIIGAGGALLAYVLKDCWRKR